MIGSIEKLEAYKKAKLLRHKLIIIARKFPAEEKYRLTDQLIRASRSITANIAEEYGKYHYQENIQYCHQARGSLLECYDHLTFSNEESLISEGLFNKICHQINEVIGFINGYIIYLKKRKSEEKTV